MAFDIEYAERIIKASADAALKRMRQADEKLERAQRATGEKAVPLAEALEEYNQPVRGRIGGLLERLE